MAAFLPPEVVLKDWVEQRIGGEVEFKADSRGQENVHLTPSARPYVTAQYEQPADLAGDPGARRAVAASLPPEVMLKDWVEQRIGGEVEFKADSRGQEIVHLTPSARP